MCNIHKQQSTLSEVININCCVEDGQYYLLCIQTTRLNFSIENYKLTDEVLLNSIKEQLKLIYNLGEESANAWIFDSGVMVIKIRKSSSDNIIDDINKIIPIKDLVEHQIRVGYINLGEITINNAKLSYLIKIIKNNKYIVKDKVTEEFCLDSKIKIYMEVKEDLLNNGGRYIKLNYQPKVYLKNTSIKACEVLCRWIHPNLGIYYPNDILPIIEHLEENSLFNLLVLEKACKEISKTKDLVDNFSINILVDDISKTEFIDKICCITKRYDIPPEKITFEIVETTEAVDYAIVARNINRMASLGYKFSIDDFGTGYSSYFRLSYINFSEVKVPRAFLDMYNTKYSKKSKSILNGIITMCKQLGCNIVVEGVETYEEFKLCRMLRVDCIQGYYVSKPLSIDSYIDYLRKNS